MPDHNLTAYINESFKFTTDTEGELFTGEDGKVSAEALSIIRIYIIVGRTTMAVLLVCGTVGNVMTIVVMRGMRAGQSSASMAVYFIALAVSDQVLLLTGGLHHWVLDMFDVSLRSVNDVLCKVLIFSVYCSSMTSAWVLVAMTTHRMTSVVWPHLTGAISSGRTSLIVVVCIVSFMAALNSHELFAYSVSSFTVNPYNNGTERICHFFNHPNLSLRYFEYSVFPWVDMTISSILPFCLLLVDNTLLIRKVAQSVSFARKMTSGGSSKHVMSREKKASSMTIMVTVASIAFLVLTLPVIPMNYAHYAFFLTGDSVDAARGALGVTIATLLYYCNSAINFYLYCLSGTKFRNELKRCICKG